ncbi:MAG TPA: hypothetical protein VMN76_02745 [Acidobacteriota bacterium]|nr:hypothetical protein [Acidobacteriota bacterium]
MMTLDRQLTIRRLADLAEMDSLVELQREIWGYGDAGQDFPYPARALFSISESGGLVAGAYAGERLAGFSAAWLGLAPDNQQWYLHSQLLGVRDQYRRLNVGYRLKLYQRDFALKRGLDRIRWTFDPLQAVNANLNLRKLGAVVQTYRPNYFGSAASRFNRDAETDRVWAEWLIDSRLVERRLQGGTASPASLDETLLINRTVERRTDDRRLLQPESWKPGLREPKLLLEIPDSFDHLRVEDAELARDWRIHLREAFLFYLADGYRAVDFLSLRAGDRRRNAYLLSNRPLEELLNGD